MKYLLVPAGAAFFALFPLPIDAYTFIRWIVFGGCTYAVFGMWRAGGNLPIYTVPLGVLALLFNPIFPVYLQRSTWLVVDVVAGAFLAWLSMLSPQQRKPTNDRTPSEDPRVSVDLPTDQSSPDSALASRVDRFERNADSFVRQILWASVGSIVLGGLMIFFFRR